MSRGSSIHIEKATPGILLHNTREKSNIKNSIFSQANNEYLRNGRESMKMYKNAIENRIRAYTERTHQKIQKKTILLFDAVVNLEKQHTLKDVQKVAEYIVKQTGTKIVNIAIHRDEGHVENGEKKINYHAHITFLGLDGEGRSIRRKFTKNFLRELQNKTAEILHMERGHSVGRKHLSANDYKYVMKVLQQEKQKIIERYQKHRNYFENYQHFFEKYSNIVQKVRTGEMNVDTAKAVINDVAGMYDRGILEKINILQLSKIMQIGAIALAQIKADIKSQNAIAREIEKGQGMALSTIERTLSDILRFVKMQKMHNNMQEVQHREGGIEI